MEVPPLDLASLGAVRAGEASAEVRRRVIAARERQQARFGRDGPTCNARMGPAELARHVTLGVEGQRLLLAACERLGLSARGFDRVRRVARTLADLDGAEPIGNAHVAEALQYRRPGIVGRD